jgi:hypothetical protein
MADEKDLLGKADALLRRHSLPPPSDGSDTGGVPILTDLVDAPDDNPFPQALPDGELAREILDHVVGEVEARITAELERRLMQHLEPQVQSAVASAVGDLHQELANAVGDAIAEALRRRQVK